MKANLTALTKIAMASLFLGVALAQGGVVAQESSDTEKVKAASQAFYAALNARDPSAMAKVYAHTPYVAYIPPVGSEVAVGWEAVNKSWEEVLLKVTSRIDMSYNRAGGPQIDGNLAWEVGTERGPVTFADGKTVDFGVLSTNIYQKIDGRWLMISHQAGQIPK
jgi:ketosteroid isomerase-like protein